MSGALIQAAVDGLALHSPQSLVLVVNDNARSTPTDQVISGLKRRWPMCSMRAVVATGTHKPDAATRAAHEALVLADIDAVHWHRDDAPEVTREWLANDPVVGIGSVEPHYFAGWTGAHKTLTVGIWNREHITRNHAHATSFAAQPARLEGNPVFEDLMSTFGVWQASRPTPALAINLVVDNDTVVAAGGGTPRQALDSVLDVARRTWIERVDVPFDRLIAHVEAPLDGSLYQALKGVENHGQSVRDGGGLLLVATCPGGVGTDHFMATLEAAPDFAAVNSLLEQRGYALGDHKALRLRHLTDVRHMRLAIVSQGLLKKDARTCEATLHPTIEEGLHWLRAQVPGNREHVVRDAGNRVTLLTDA